MYLLSVLLLFCSVLCLNISMAANRKPEMNLKMYSSVLFNSVFTGVIAYNGFKKNIKNFRVLSFRRQGKLLFLLCLCLLLVSKTRPVQKLLAVSHSLANPIIFM